MTLDDSQIIEVLPFSCQPDEEGFIIGNVEAGDFFAVPREAVQILGWLSKGHTYGETRTLYRDLHGEDPDMEEFLLLLRDKHMVAFTLPEEQTAPAGTGGPTPQGMRFHFTGFPQALAERLFSRGALLFYGVLVIAALAILAHTPDLLPARADMVFTRHMSLYMLLFLAFQLGTVFIHEMGHLIAGKAQGIEARLGFGNRLWVIVAETDLTGLWSLPRRARILPLLGGPITDAVMLALFTFGLYGLKQGWYWLPPSAAQFARAMYLFLMFRLVWQCYFFVRTDFYYVFTTLFNCKNLLEDTQAYLANRLKSWFRFGTLRDLSAIGPRELRVIQWYSLVWIGGRILALGVLFTFMLPICRDYLLVFFSTFKTGLDHGFYPVLDRLGVVVIALGIYGIGFYMWGRSLIGTYLLRRSKA